MAKKTNKTSHVLDLLTNGTSSESNGATVRNTIPKNVKVIDEGSRNDSLSQNILNSLSEELASEVSQEEDLTMETVTASVDTQEYAVQQDSQPEQSSEIQIPYEPSTSDPNTVAELRSPFGKHPDDGFHFLNVMEELLMQQDLDNLLKKYNVCTCRRCKADVCALTLTALPSKYVVISKSSLSPVLNYYKNKFQIPMLTELSKACATIRERPHHSR